MEHLLTGLPGGQVGFLIVVNLMIFFLAFFLDYFELSFIVVPLLGPVAEKMGIDLIWFGVLLAVNMQTSFMHPPFGFALFFLRSVAPEKQYVDRVTHKVIDPVTTMQIYKGAVPFVIIQLVMVGVLIAFPSIVTGSLDKKVEVNMDAVSSEMLNQLGQDNGYGSGDESAPPAEPGYGEEAPAEAADPAASDASAPAEPASSDAPAAEGYGSDDPMKAMQEAAGKK